MSSSLSSKKYISKKYNNYIYTGEKEIIYTEIIKIIIMTKIIMYISTAY